jgi:hypothetical protein
MKYLVRLGDGYRLISGRSQDRNLLPAINRFSEKLKKSSHPIFNSHKVGADTKLYIHFPGKVHLRAALHASYTSDVFALITRQPHQQNNERRA